MATSFFKGVELNVFSGVYMPSEDSFILAENVEASPGARVLDLGSGCGIQGINAAILGAKKVVCTDISSKALRNARQNAEKLGFGKKFRFRQGNLFSCFGKNEKFDLIVFNPPYVASDSRKYADLDGGAKGREVLDPFLQHFGGHLAKNGVCFFLQSSLNGLKETEKMLKKQGVSFRVVAEKRVFFEKLLVLKCWK